MKIGIIVAMEKELRLLMPMIAGLEEHFVNGYNAYRGKIGLHDVVLMQCGIGKVNSALKTSALLECESPELIINTGVAGGADPSMHVLDLLVATEVAYHDVWCGPGTEYGAASGLDVFMIPSERVVSLAKASLNEDNVKYGLICSGDKFISKESEIKEIKSNFPDAVAVDMESASIAQVCEMKGVPFAIIRVISDTPGQAENISQYKNFWVEAPDETFRALIRILKALGR